MSFYFTNFVFGYVSPLLGCCSHNVSGYILTALLLHQVRGRLLAISVLLTDTVLQWFSSYMTDRTHYVSIMDACWQSVYYSLHKREANILFLVGCPTSEGGLIYLKLVEISLTSAMHSDRQSVPSQFTTTYIPQPACFFHEPFQPPFLPLTFCLEVIALLKI